MTESQINNHAHDALPIFSPWKRSAKGNLWRRLPDGRTVSVFPRAGRYAWSIAHKTPRFSIYNYDSENEAVAALLAELERMENAEVDQ